MTPYRQCKSAHLPVRWTVLLVLWASCLAGPLLAVTLGQETILSQLGDPVEVEIDVLQWDGIDPERVQIALASPAEYENFDLSWLPVLDQLAFNLVGPNPRGEFKVLVSTRDPVTEPYMELLLVIRWPGGSLLREYVLLFDLPMSPVLSDAPAVVSQPDVVAMVESDTAPPMLRHTETTSSGPAVVPDTEPGPDAVSGEDVPEPRNQGAIVVEAVLPAAQPVPPATGRRVYQVREGDGLWSIAQQFQPAGAGENIYQMLLSLHDLNRAAFINGNVSLLKANALLQIPDVDDISAVDAASAEARFEQRWDEGTMRLQTALRGDPLPAFSDLYEGDNIEEGPQAVLEAQVPGEETGRIVPRGNGLLLPATTPVVVPLSEMQAPAAGVELQLEEPEPRQVIEQLPSNADSPAAAGQDVVTTSVQDAAVNPYLDRIESFTRDMQPLLQNRSLQVASLEDQLVEMRQRMKDAQQVTARLNEALELALARREEQQAASARSTILLGLVALVLLVALAAAIYLLLKLAAQPRRQHRLRVEDASAWDDADDLKLSAGTAALRRSPAYAAQTQNTGILVEEADVRVSNNEDLQQELPEIIGPAVADIPERDDHGRNRA